MARPVYRADPPVLYRSVMLDGLTILHHRRSASTHVLAPPAPELIAALEQGPADAATLLARLAAAHDLPDATPALIEARLDELAEAGLVARE